MKEEGIKIRIDSKLKEEFKKVCDQESVTMSDKIHKFIVTQTKVNEILKIERLMVKINEKFYRAEKKGNKLILDGNLHYDPFGYLFFKKWKNETCEEKNGNVGYKKDFSKTIDFNQGECVGIFEGVFVVNAIDGVVTLSYDNEKIL